jgi:Flp pilus assembly protein TadD
VSDPVAARLTPVGPVDRGAGDALAHPAAANGPVRRSSGAASTSIDPAAAAPLVAEGDRLTQQGIHLCRTARWRAAIEPLQRATQVDPTNAAAFYHLGDACNHADALAHALEAFEAAVRLQPDHWRALKGIGIVLDRMRRPQEAAAAYQRARDAQNRSAPRSS